KARIVEVRLYFLPQPGYRVIDRPRERRLTISPELPEQLVAMHNQARPLAEIFQDFELAVRQMQVSPVAARRVASGVNLQRPEREHIGFRPRSPQHRSDSREQLVEIEGLRDVIVGAEVEALQLVGLLCLRREHQDRRVPEPTKRCAQIETADTWK